MNATLFTSSIVLEPRRSGPAGLLPSRIVLRDASGWPVGVPYFG